MPLPIRKYNIHPQEEEVIFSLAVFLLCLSLFFESQTLRNAIFGTSFRTKLRKKQEPLTKEEIQWMERRRAVLYNEHEAVEEEEEQEQEEKVVKKEKTLEKEELQEEVGPAFESNRRIVSSVGSIVFFLFSLYVFLFDKETRRDPVLGYSKAAHNTFIAVAIFHVFDMMLLCMHPTKKRITKAVWSLHRVGIAFFCLIMLKIQMGSIPALCLLMPMLHTLGSNIKWHLKKLDADEERRLLKVAQMSLLTTLIYMVTTLCPLSMYFYYLAFARGVSVMALLHQLLRWQCVVGLFLVTITRLGFLVAMFKTTREAEQAYRQHQKSTKSS